MRITSNGRVLIGDTVERYNVEAYQQLQIEGLGYAASSMSDLLTEAYEIFKQKHDIEISFN